MKIAKALKLKNQLAGDVAKLKERLAQQNSRPAKQKFDYDIHLETMSKVDVFVSWRTPFGRSQLSRRKKLCPTESQSQARA